MGDDQIFRWGEVSPFPDGDLLVSLPALVPAGVSRKSLWGIHPPPYTQHGVVTNEAFPKAIQLLYICGSQGPERLQGPLVQLL